MDGVNGTNSLVCARGSPTSALRTPTPTPPAFVILFAGTIMAYGQTGSGKTHTMFGPDEVYIFNLT